MQGINAQYGGRYEDAVAYAEWLAETQPLFKVGWIRGGGGCPGRPVQQGGGMEMESTTTDRSRGSTHAALSHCRDSIALHH